VFLCQETSPTGCSDIADFQAIAQTLQTNVDTILSALRDDAGYDGQIVVVSYYALNYGDALGAATGAIGGQIAQLAARYDADVADGYAAFQPGAAGAGGSSIAAGLVLPNDVHPSEAGQQLLAEAVLAVAD